MQDLDEAYRTYAPRLLAYCTALLHDRDAAADAVHDTFLAAARQHELRDPARFEAWLYTVARNNCISRVRQEQRTFSYDFDAEASTPTDPIESVQAEQVRELVHSAAAALSDADREIIELALRHSLSPSALSTVLDVPANHVHARLSRARTQLERAIGALLLARDGSAACPQLAEVLDGWDGRLDPLTRKRINRHVDGCDRCSSRRGVLASAASLLTAYAALPFFAASTVDMAALVPNRPRHRRGVRKAAVPAALAVAVLGGVLALGRCDRPVPSADPTTLPPQPAMGSPAGPGVKAPAPPPSHSPPRPSPAQPSPGAPFTVAVTERSTTCTTQSNTYKLHVEITTSAAYSSARLYWIEGSWPRHSLPITATGVRSGEVTKILLKETTEWWVQAVAADGSSAQTPHATVRSPCL